MDMTSWKTQAKRLKDEIQALYLAARDPRTPWYVKVIAAFIIGYALSPIDLIPDFIPFLGYLDDLVIVPVGVALLIRLIPTGVLEDCREKARSRPMSLRRDWIAGIIIISIWLLLIYMALSLLWKIVKG